MNSIRSLLAILVLCAASAACFHLHTIELVFHGDNCRDIDPVLWDRLATKKEVPFFEREMVKFIDKVNQGTIDDPCAFDFPLLDANTRIVHPRARIIGYTLEGKPLARHDHMAHKDSHCGQLWCAIRATSYNTFLVGNTYSPELELIATALDMNLGANFTKSPSILWSLAHTHHSNNAHPYHRMEVSYDPDTGKAFTIGKHDFRRSVQIGESTWYPKVAKPLDRPEDLAAIHYRPRLNI